MPEYRVIFEVTKTYTLTMEAGSPTDITEDGAARLFAEGGGIDWEDDRHEMIEIILAQCPVCGELGFDGYTETTGECMNKECSAYGGIWPDHNDTDEDNQQLDSDPHEGDKDDAPRFPEQWVKVPDFGPDGDGYDETEDRDDYAFDSDPYDLEYPQL